MTRWARLAAKTTGFACCAWAAVCLVRADLVEGIRFAVLGVLALELETRI